MTKSLLPNINIEDLMNKEIWTDVKDFEGVYQVSSFGRVRSITRKIHYRNSFRMQRGRLMKLQLTVYGYLQVKLVQTTDTKVKYYRAPVHQLVAKAFIPNPHHYTEIHHKDYDKTNNNVNNLMWCSRKFNQDDMVKHYGIANCQYCKRCGQLLKDNRNTTGLCSNCLKYKQGLKSLNKYHNIKDYKELQSLIQKHGIKKVAKQHNYIGIGKLKNFCNHHNIKY